MKDWVKTYILRRTAEDLAESGKDEAEKKEWMTIKSKMLDDKEVMYHELISCLNCHFTKESEEGEGFFYHVFGSVVADLPEDVFQRLCSMKNLFFVYTPGSRAETKVIELKSEIKEQKLQVVVFPYDADFFPSTVLRGEIVRQLVHVHSGLADLIEQEDQIESIATEWGFGEEVKAIAEHKMGKKPVEGEAPPSPEKERVPSKTQEFPVLVMKQKKTSKETTYEAKWAVTTIGRRPGNDIVLKHPTVSRRHAEICAEGDSYFLYDVASTNGTRLNGRYVNKEKLSDGDVIKIGPFTFTFKAAVSS